MNKAGSFDGKLSFSAGQLKLFDEDEKLLVARSLSSKDKLEDGGTLMIGKWEVECGALLGGGVPQPPPPMTMPPPVPTSGPQGASSSSSRAPAFKRPALGGGLRRFAAPGAAASAASGGSASTGSGAAMAISSTSASASASFASSSSSCTTATTTAGAAASAAAADADIVLNRGDEHAKASVVVDRQLARLLRPWQVEGVQFMYDCVSGRRLGASGAPLSGCILAHDPGLGKTLTAITVLFTLLRGGPGGGPLIKKAVVVCPASLCKNWAAEVKRWLPNRLRAILLPEKTSEVAEALRDFVRCPPQKLLILSYEAARIHADTLEAANVGLMICDEGHKLKASGGSQTVDALKRISKVRRVILTGTPLQNNYDEFWALCDFVSPNELGSLHSFHHAFARPMEVGKQPHARADEVEAASEAQAGLRALTDPFLQRRDRSVLSSLLPPRTEVALFPRLSPAQSSAYQRIVGAGLPSQHVFASLRQLQSLCSCADLDGEGASPETTETTETTESMGGGGGGGPGQCAKLHLLLRLLEPVRARGEHVVICSTFRKSLDMLQGALTSNGWGALRVDGSTPVSQRQLLVDRFNAKGCQEFAFLLASRAGGAGFNLTGASRLVLFDPDWNPAIDEQAMGRVYRQGQRRPVHIWRMLHAGTIEEKIFQRQLAKQGMSDLIDGQAAGSGAAGDVVAGTGMGAPALDERADLSTVKFKSSELRQIFSYDPSGACSTLSQLLGRRQSALAAEMSAASSWVAALPDELLKQTLHADAALCGALTFACDVATLRGLQGGSADDDDDDDADADAEKEKEADEGGGASKARAGRSNGPPRGRKPAGRGGGDEAMESFEDSEEGEDRSEDEFDFDDGFIVDDGSEEQGNEGEEEEDSDGVSLGSEDEEERDGVSQLEFESEEDEGLADVKPARGAKRKRARRKSVISEGEGEDE